MPWLSPLMLACDNDQRERRHEIPDLKDYLAKQPSRTLVDGGSLVGQGATDGVGLADDGGFDVGDAVALAAEGGEVIEGVGVGVFEPVDDELEGREGVGGVVEVEGDGGVVGHWSVSGVGRCRGR